ncbi:hypothetical protein [Aliiroseovarius sp. F20344]|uniref:hypothetical protein n=1 Tax=Aliiroseovarius sp. F20344 TaxID=2926414 RepID=UPI001FF275F6|nr:hypothetical protein [Aliiroseovarius sp. F20344]MCK0142268.1 hypothetical protein [Aliiroseovarius sp. F20344]
MSHRYDKKSPKGCDPYDKLDEPRLPYNPFPWPRVEDLPRFPELPISVFLVLRGTIPDDGSRPIATLGGGSPDIQIDGPTTTLFTLTNIAHLVPAPGSEQRIAARVWNFGDNTAVAARVRFWEVRTLQGSSPEPELIGAAFIDVPYRSSISVQCPEVWRPSNASRVSVMVDVSDAVNDPVTAPFDPFSDRHVAQKIIVSA